MDSAQKKQKIDSGKSLESYEERGVGSELQLIKPLAKLLPANELISQNVKGDIDAKVLIKNLYEVQRQRQRASYGGPLGKLDREQIIERMCFQEQDCLGYEFQSGFEKKLIYSRLFDSLENQHWLSLITYSSAADAKTIEKEQNRSIKFLAGLFTQNRHSVTKQLSGLHCHNIENPHLLHNNLSIVGPQGQKNYQPNLISFSASHPSSNLMFVFRTSFSEFSLVLHNDTNSKGSTQWFNFTVSLPPKHPFEEIKFNIVNLTKSNSLFPQGMKVVYRHKKDNNWKRLPGTPGYFQNNVDIEGRKEGTKYNTLSFTYTPKFHQGNKAKQEIVSFAYGYPYTFEDNFRFWAQLQKKIVKNKLKVHVSRECIGKSVSGMPIEVYRLTPSEQKRSFSLATSFYSYPNQKSAKKCIVILARQHSGETQGSFIMEGAVDFIVGSHLSLAKRNFIYHFVPIVNVEGTLLGNYRTNLRGYDLNRNWRNPVTEAQPEVVAIKRYLHKINKQNEITLIMDLHGHSRALNSFFYGVEKSKSEENSKIFPFFCSKLIKKISFSQSYFTVAEDKRNTARAVLSEMFPKALVYTLESSFHGYQVKQGDKKQIVDYSPSQLRKLGAELISAYFQYSQLSEPKAAQASIYQKHVSKESITKQIEEFQWKKAMNSGKVEKLCEESDSEAEQQLIDVMNTSEIVKAQIKANKCGGKVGRKIRNMDYQINKKAIDQKRIYNGKGHFLKTIQMIQTTRSQLSSQFFIHKMQRDPEKQKILKMKNRRKMEKTISGTQQKQNMRPKADQKPLEMTSKKQVPGIKSKMLSIRRLSHRNKRPDSIRFVNQRQETFQQIRKRRVQGNKNVKYL